MAGVALELLTTPVSEVDPCGSDLDLEGDPDYLNFMAKAEGILPASYFSVHDGKPFDRTSIDFGAEFEAAKPLLERTRDLRLVVTLAKLHILNRDLSAFLTCIEGVATLLDAQWENVHPRGEGDDFALRMAAVETLDDLPTVVHPLQFVPLVNHRRLGAITYRSYITATGEIRPREDEAQQIDATTIDKALMDVELPALVESLRQFEALQSALGRIRSAWIERAGFGQAVNLDKASQIVARILSLVGGVVAKRDPSAAGPGDAAGATEGAASAALSQDQITSRADAGAALAAVAEYFSRVEPSSPAILLIRQAQQLVGRSFADAMRILVPAYMDQANIAVGTQYVFDLPIERLSALEPAIETSLDEFAPKEPAGQEPTSEEPHAVELMSSEYTSERQSPDGSAPSEEQVSEESAPAARLGNPAGGELHQNSDSDPPTPSRGGATVPGQCRRAGTRQQAFVLLDQIAAYYRAAEPSSPIPVIVDRARYLAARDFMSLLKDFLPEAALRSTITEG